MGGTLCAGKSVRECLAIDVAKKLTSEDVLERLSDLLVHKSVPDHIRSDNGPEFTAKCVRGGAGARWREDLVYRAWLTIGRMATWRA